MISKNDVIKTARAAMRATYHGGPGFNCLCDLCEIIRDYDTERAERKAKRATPATPCMTVPGCLVTGAHGIHQGKETNITSLQTERDELRRMLVEAQNGLMIHYAHDTRHYPYYASIGNCYRCDTWLAARELLERIK